MIYLAFAVVALLAAVVMFATAASGIVPGRAGRMTPLSLVPRAVLLALSLVAIAFAYWCYDRANLKPKPVAIEVRAKPSASYGAARRSTPAAAAEAAAAAGPTEPLPVSAPAAPVATAAAQPAPVAEPPAPVAEPPARAAPAAPRALTAFETCPGIAITVRDTLGPEQRDERLQLWFEDIWIAELAVSVAQPRAETRVCFMRAEHYHYALTGHVEHSRSRVPVESRDQIDAEDGDVYDVRIIEARGGYRLFLEEDR